MKKKNTLGLVHYIVYCFNFTTGNQCFPYYIQISTPQFWPPSFNEQAYCKKSRSAKVKDGIINLILRNYLIHRYIT